MPKKYFYLMLLAPFLGTAQTINFPDANFKELLLNIDTNPSVYAKDIDGNLIAIDTNEDGEIQVAEAQTVAILSITDMADYVSDLEGIEHFTNLRELYCGNQSLSSLDVTSLINLEILQADNNFLSSLDVSGLSNLKELDCNTNFLSSLNLTGASNLQLLYCYTNSLTVLDVHECTDLVSLVCTGNLLTTLNISGLSNLEIINCNQNEITALDLASATSVQTLACSLNNISSLDISNCTALTEIYFSYNQLTTLDASNSPITILAAGFNNLESLYLKNGALTEGLDLSMNPNLSYICADEGEIAWLQQTVDEFEYDCLVDSACSLNAQDFNFNESISIYPNPAENTLYLNNKANLTLETAEVYNLLGQAVIMPSNTNSLRSVDISSLSSGTYILKVTHDKGVFASKFIKK